MITTIQQYFKSGNVIFDQELSEYEYMTADIISALNYILKYKYGKNNIFSDDQTDITDAVNAMFLLNDDKYTALYNIDRMVNPADEYNETQILSGRREIRKTGTSTLADTGTSTTADTGTQTTEVTPETINVNTFSKKTSDNDSMRQLEMNQSSSTGSDTSVRTDALQSQRTDNLQHQRTDNLSDVDTNSETNTKQGYTNKFSNADFILNLSRNNLYDTIIEDTIKCIVIPVYNCDEV